MQSSLFFALLVALAASLYQVCQRFAAGVNSYVVAIVVSAVAILFALLVGISTGRVSIAEFHLSKTLWLFLLLIGLSAFSIDFFSSKAYIAGGSVSTIGPIITSGVILLTGLFGIIFFKEPLTLMKLVGFGLMAGGVFLVSWKS